MIIGILLLPTLSHGETVTEKPISFEIGAQAFRYSYDEPSIMAQDGWLYGISYALTYQRDWMFRLEGVVAIGHVDYSSDISGSMDNLDNLMTETRGLFGYTLHNPQRTLSGTIFSGIAYRYLNNDMEGHKTTIGADGYNRTSHYFYSPIGASVKTGILNAWQVKLTLEYDLFWFGKQESDLGSLSGYEDITNDQESGYGYRASLAFEKKITPKYSIGIEPFYRYWDIDDSEKATDSLGRRWKEPENRTTEYGLNISIFF